MDQFAQSREDDDLFGDDFEPVSTPTIIEDTHSHPSHTSPPPSQITRSDTNPPGLRNGRTQDVRREQGAGGRGRGRGNGNGNGNARGGAVNGLAASRYAAQPAATIPPTPDKAPEPPTAQAQESTEATHPQAPLSDTTPPSTEPTQPAPPTEPSTPNRAPAVRGSRLLTGGPPQKKLTEAELTAKLARMAILNAQKSERFRLSEADSAAFAEKEREAQRKRKEEEKNARVMEVERQRNRERKLRSKGGREWDLEKEEVEDKKGRSSEYVRGGHGGVIRGGGGGLGGSRFAGEVEVEGNSEEANVGERGTRGRGGFEGRGRGRGRGGGRGGKNVNTVPVADDFPSLPTPAKAITEVTMEVKTTTPVTAEKIKSPDSEKAAGDWAEEMATPVQEKKVDV